MIASGRYGKEDWMKEKSNKKNDPCIEVEQDHGLEEKTGEANIGD